ncbi:MAG: hypothetical protein K2G27_05060 [Duncaniella sp.]|nr:hypothetical protein [Duncaniella sp.]
MKKLLLSAISAVTFMGMSAAVPVLTQQNTGSLTVTQETPGYSNPSTYDASGNLIITGAFNGTFDNADAIGTSAYIVKYNAAGQKAWSVPVVGAATIKAVDTDADGNIYVAGTYADYVDFYSTDGSQKSIGGMADEANEQYAKKNSSFLAKYDKDGKIQVVKPIVPAPLPELTVSGMYYPMDGDVHFFIENLKVNDGKVYVSSTCTGEVILDDVTVKCSYLDLYGWGIYQEIPTLSILSFDSNFENCQSVASIVADGPLTEDYAPTAHSLTFDIDGSSVYASFVCVGEGKYNYTIGSANGEIAVPSESEKYVVLSENGKLELQKGSVDKNVDNIASMIVSGSNLYIVGTAFAILPAEAADENAVAVKGSSDIFVATVGASDLKLKSLKAYSHDEGTTAVTSGDTTEDKPNYEQAVSVVSVDGSLYINAITGSTYIGGSGVVFGPESVWFDGSDFSAATAATGAAVVDGVFATVNSDASKMDFTTYTFQKSGITDIEAEYDENAPVEYYNLQGIRVANPENGLYIRRQGNKVEKILVK